MSTSNRDDHDLNWNERLLRWLDGDLDAAAAATFQAHNASCPLCQQQLQALARLDKSLATALPRIALNDAFDRRLLASIDAMDDSERAAARQRAEQELQDNLRSLARHWRRTLGLVIPGVIAGIALAFALTGWFNDTGITQAVAAQSASELGRGTAGLVQMLLTGIVGAGIGLAVARWLAAATD